VHVALSFLHTVLYTLKFFTFDQELLSQGIVLFNLGLDIVLVGNFTFRKVKFLHHEIRFTFYDLWVSFFYFNRFLGGVFRPSIITLAAFAFLLRYFGNWFCCSFFRGAGFLLGLGRGVL